MSKLLKRGFSIYKIFLKNKIAAALMMLIPGVMMLIGALQGKGNDTVAMPLGITAAGAALTFWSFYKIGYLKHEMDLSETNDERTLARVAISGQILETVLYLVVAIVGIFLLLNQAFMNRVLNLMSGGFTTLNGVLGATVVYKRKEHRNFYFWLKLVLTIIEFILGPCFLINCDMTGGGWYIAMGILTAVAGTVEVITALTPESIRSTMQDGKDIVRIIKD